MKILFLGGTGNISSAVGRLLVKQGHDLWLFNRGRRPALPGARAVAVNLSQPGGLRAAVGDGKFDAVVNWIAFTPAEVDRDLAIFAGRTAQYVFISSISVYQKPPPIPVITEDMPLGNPFLPLAQNKIRCEERLMRAWREQGFPATIVRPGHTYNHIIPVAVGTGNTWTIVDRIRRGLPVVVHGDGTSIYVVTHADDFAPGLAGILGNPRAVGETFHITSDELLNWNRIYEEIGRAVGFAPKLVHLASETIARLEPDQAPGLLGHKAHSFWCDNAKIKRFVPGFAATLPLHEGLLRTLAWFEADPVRTVIDPASHALHERLVAALPAAK